MQSKLDIFGICGIFRSEIEERLYMKRDCGIGELIPAKFQVRYCLDASDRETKLSFDTLNEAKEFYTELVLFPRGNVRVYVLDKAGYANCLLSTQQREDERVEVTNRLNEL